MKPVLISYAIYSSHRVVVRSVFPLEIRNLLSTILGGDKSWA